MEISWDSLCSIHLLSKIALNPLAYIMLMTIILNIQEGRGSSILAEWVFRHLLWAREMPMGMSKRKYGLTESTLHEKAEPQLKKALQN